MAVHVDYFKTIYFTCLSTQHCSVLKVSFLRYVYTEYDPCVRVILCPMSNVPMSSQTLDLLISVRVHNQIATDSSWQDMPLCIRYGFKTLTLDSPLEGNVSSCKSSQGVDDDF